MRFQVGDRVFTTSDDRNSKFLQQLIEEFNVVDNAENVETTKDAGNIVGLDADDSEDSEIVTIEFMPDAVEWEAFFNDLEYNPKWNLFKMWQIWFYMDRPLDVLCKYIGRPLQSSSCFDITDEQLLFLEAACNMFIEETEEIRPRYGGPYTQTTITEFYPETDKYREMLYRYGYYDSIARHHSLQNNYKDYLGNSESYHFRKQTKNSTVNLEKTLKILSQETNGILEGFPWSEQIVLCGGMWAHCYYGLPIDENSDIDILLTNYKDPTRVLDILKQVMHWIYNRCDSFTVEYKKCTTITIPNCRKIQIFALEEVSFKSGIESVKQYFDCPAVHGCFDGKRHYVSNEIKSALNHPGKPVFQVSSISRNRHEKFNRRGIIIIADEIRESVINIEAVHTIVVNDAESLEFVSENMYYSNYVAFGKCSYFLTRDRDFSVFEYLARDVDVGFVRYIVKGKFKSRT